MKKPVTAADGMLFGKRFGICNNMWLFKPAYLTETLYCTETRHNYNFGLLLNLSVWVDFAYAYIIPLCRSHSYTPNVNCLYVLRFHNVKFTRLKLLLFIGVSLCSSHTHSCWFMRYSCKLVCFDTVSSKFL